MASLLFECAIRSVLMAAATVTVLWAMRIRSASARHAAWTVVVIFMLLLPLWSIGGPTMPLPVLQPPAVSPQVAAVPGEAMPTDPVPPDTITSVDAASAGTARVTNWPSLLTGFYLLGACVLLARLLIGTVYANLLRRHAVIDSGRLTSGRCATPITVGAFGPALILPWGWQEWPAAQLDAVLTHEAEHARRHDPLVQWIALLNRAVFWFHPLSWWLERHLATLAEEACDVAVLAAGHSAQDYSDYLLDMARSVTHEGRRVRVVGMAMPGSGLTHRLRQIFDGVPANPVSRLRAVCTITLCAMSSVILAAGTLAPRSALSSVLQSPAKPKFEVASIKPCDPRDGGGARGSGAGSPTSPGRLQTECRTILNLIQNAYIVFADGRLHSGWDANALPIEGVPGWNKSDQFQIEAKADGPATAEAMRGPMMQSLLEDRFKLKLHRETREVPVYEMVVAKGGAKVKPFDLATGTCTTFDLSSFPQKPNVPGRPACGQKVTRIDGTTYRRDVEGVSLDEFVVWFFLLDRPVVNHTGIPGLVGFSVQLDMSDPASVIPALKDQVGLELRPAIAPRDFLVIDHVERPRPDVVVGAAVPGTPNDPALETLRAAASGPHDSSADAPPQDPPSPTSSTPKFDVVSIKPCESMPEVPEARSAGPGFPSPARRLGASPGLVRATPGRINITCMTAVEMILRAYNQYGDPPVLNAVSLFSSEMVTAGPAWARSERYSIEAMADGTPATTVMLGAMLRALLEDRFRLKIHQNFKDVQALALTVAASGLKLKPESPGVCAPPDPSYNGPRTAGPDGRVRETGRDTPLCSTASGGRGPNQTFDVFGQTLGRISGMLGSAVFGRPVINKTGVSGQFTFHVEFAPEENASEGPGFPFPSSDPAAGPSIFTVFEQQLGLKLSVTKAPQGYLVIDHIEQPRPNPPGPIQ